MKRTKAKSPATVQEIDSANKLMLMGVRFTLKILGVAGDGLLAKFVEQEFQAWVREIAEKVKQPEPINYRITYYNSKTGEESDIPSFATNAPGRRRKPRKA